MKKILKIIKNKKRMKKLFILIFAMLLLVSCRPTSSETYEYEEVVCSDGTVLKATKFWFEDHLYVCFRGTPVHSTPVYSKTGIVHDPNCWCMEDVD